MLFAEAVRITERSICQKVLEWLFFHKQGKVLGMTACISGIPLGVEFKAGFSFISTSASPPSFVFSTHLENNLLKFILGRILQNSKTEHSFHHYPLAKAIVSYCVMIRYDELRSQFDSIRYVGVINTFVVSLYVHSKLKNGKTAPTTTKYLLRPRKHACSRVKTK